MKILTKYIPASILTAFGLLTLFLTTTILLDLFGMREKNEGFTPFVIWANLISGLIYMASAYGFLKSKSWTTKLLTIALLLLIGTFIAFNIYINNGGIHKNDTFGALFFRISITTIFTVISYFTITKIKKQNSNKLAF